MSSLESVFTVAIDPHPDLVAVQTPTASQMLVAAAELGFYPSDGDRPYWPLLRSWVARGGV